VSQDIALIDMNLPDLSGVDVLRELRQHPATRN
jgi:CheY-like chemotaxis protein